MTQRRPWISVAAIAVAFALAAPATAETFSGRVVGITDRDTISVLRDGQAVKVRLGGIDCPERGQDFGTRQATADLVYTKTVRVEIRDHDRYGRIVGRVLVGDTDVSLALVEQGLAWHYKRYSSEQALADAEASARAARRGLWSRADAVPPWNWRRDHRTPGPAEPPRAQTTAMDCVPAEGCCRVCRKGQACGDSCISATATCRKGPGCACDGAGVCP